MGREALEERSDFRSLVDHLDGVAIWFVSGQGGFDYISAGFEDIWGIPPEEVEDDPARLIETIHPDDRDRVRANIQRDDPDASYEGRVVKPDGSVRWLHTRQVPIQDDDGDVSTVIGISTDITEQKRREKELDALNRLIRHDVRNDVNVILGRAEMLEDHVDGAGEDYLQRIQNAGSHIVELTEVAGDYAKTVTRERDMETTRVSLGPVLQRAVDLAREMFPEAEFRIDGDVPDVDVMANDLLDSVFRNFLNNAVQHNDADHPVVEVRCDATAETVDVHVADNGPGIPDHRKDVIFENGERGIESAGTGIGLHLVQTLVDQYDGTVTVTDNSPTGSVFSVSLPRA